MTSNCPKCGSCWIHPVQLRAGARVFECSNHNCRARYKQKVRQPEARRVAKEASIYLGQDPNAKGTKKLEQALNTQQLPTSQPRFTQGQVCHPEFPMSHEPE